MPALWRPPGGWVLGARTVRMLATRPACNPFEMPTLLQIFPHPSLTSLKNVASAPRLESLQTCLVQMPRLGSWLELGESSLIEFWRMVESGTSVDIPGRFERLGLWDDLCEILDYVGRREGVSYVRIVR